jgi:16S rRNA (uracil1498-N3)-methyltransferase
MGQCPDDAPVSHTFRYRVTAAPVPGGRVVLDSGDAHHLARVVRRAPGDAVEVIAPAGEIWPATVVAVAPDAVVEMGAGPLRRAAAAPLTLYVGLCEWGRLDIAVEKCTELGIARMVVFAGARSKRVPDGAAWDRRRERLLRVAGAATRQSGQPAVPDVDGMLSFDDVLADIDGDTAVVLDPSGAVPLADAVGGLTGVPLALVTGPDSGFDADELARARAAGATVCHLGRNTLRAETAVIVAAGIAMAVTGYLDDGASGPLAHEEDD